MLFLVLSKAGFEELKTAADPQHDHIWLNKDVLCARDIQMLNEQGWHLHVFSEAIHTSNEHSILKAIKYLEKKFPTEEIEVEYL